MKRERYTAIFDAGSALVPGTIDLYETENGVSGHISMLGHGTTISHGEFDEDKRCFAGTIWYLEEEVPFEAEGIVRDGMLDLNISILGRVFPLTGFPTEEA